MKKCFNEAKEDVVTKLSDFKDCQEMSGRGNQVWTENEWFDCYQQKEQAHSDGD